MENKLSEIMDKLSEVSEKVDQLTQEYDYLNQVLFADADELEYRVLK